MSYPLFLDPPQVTMTKHAHINEAPTPSTMDAITQNLQERIRNLPEELRRNIWQQLAQSVENSFLPIYLQRPIGVYIRKFLGYWNPWINCPTLADKDKETLRIMSLRHPIIESRNYGSEYLQELIRVEDFMFRSHSLGVRDLQHGRDNFFPLAELEKWLAFLRRRNLVNYTSVTVVHFEGLHAGDQLSKNRNGFMNDMNTVLRGLFECAREFPRSRLVFKITYVRDPWLEVTYPINRGAETRERVMARLRRMDREIKDDMEAFTGRVCTCHIGSHVSNRCENCKASCVSSEKSGIFFEIRTDRQELWNIMACSEILCDIIEVLGEEFGPQ